MDELKKLEQGLIDKAQLQRIADDLSKAAEIKYDTAIDKAMNADPELRELWDKNQKAHAAAKAAKDDYAAAKTNAVKAGDSYELPFWLHTHWGGVVDVNAVIKPTISDAKIAKPTAK